MDGLRIRTAIDPLVEKCDNVLVLSKKNVDFKIQIGMRAGRQIEDIRSMLMYFRSTIARDPDYLAVRIGSKSKLAPCFGFIFRAVALSLTAIEFQAEWLESLDSSEMFRKMCGDKILEKAGENLFHQRQALSILVAAFQRRPKEVNKILDHNENLTRISRDASALRDILRRTYENCTISRCPYTISKGYHLYIGGRCSYCLFDADDFVKPFEAKQAKGNKGCAVM
jgi:hypothetical protein